MDNGQLFLGVLVVCLAQVVFCCGASARKECQTMKINESHTNLSQDSKLSNFLRPGNDTREKDQMNNYTIPDNNNRCKRNKTKKQEQNLQRNTSVNKIINNGIPRVITTSRINTISSVETVQATNRVSYRTSTESPPTTTKATSSIRNNTVTKTHHQQNFTLPTSKIKRDPCTRWEQCSIHHHPKVQAWLHSLPACPCRYPYRLYYNNTIYDRIQGRFYSWRNVNAKLEKLAVFKPTASYCIRNLLPNSATTTATQQCCYDHGLRLITRGSGTGTPNLVAPELDEGMHYNVDLMPFISCQGDWTRYQAVRPPNNALKCRENPKKEEFWRQIKRAKDF